MSEYTITLMGKIPHYKKNGFKFPVALDTSGTRKQDTAREVLFNPLKNSQGDYMFIAPRGKTFPVKPVDLDWSIIEKETQVKNRVSGRTRGNPNPRPKQIY